MVTKAVFIFQSIMNNKVVFFWNSIKYVLLNFIFRLNLNQIDSGFLKLRNILNPNVIH